MPMARLGDEVELWITENGYATEPRAQRGEPGGRPRRRRSRTSTSYSGTLDVTDYRYFNLRDNRANGTDLFDNVGLLGPITRESPRLRPRGS